MKITKLKTATTKKFQSETKLDLETFSAELKELGSRYNFKLISFGGVIQQVGDEKTMFLAVWTAETSTC